MTQYYTPDADISNAGLWTATPLYQKVDEASYSDADYIACPVNATNAECVLGLPDVTDPGVHTGHTLRIRASKTVKQSCNIQYALYQGTTAIHTVASFNPSQTTFTEYSYTLSEAEAANITNYADLRVYLTASSTAGGYTQISWVQFEVPDAASTNCQLVIGETWKSASGFQIIVGSDWKTVTSMKVVMGETWKDVF
jgi:hypothetical protein